MRSIRILLIVGAFLTGIFTAQAQFDLPIIPSINVPISAQAVGIMEEDEMPSREELRLLGLSEEEIDIIFLNMEALEEPDPLDSYQSGQDALRAPTNIQGDGGTAVESTEGIEPDVVPAIDPALAVKPELIYGHRYFRTISSYENATGVRAPDYYILKPGDEMTISAFGGGVDFQGIYTLNEDGYIFQKEAGRVYVKGMELGDAKVLLRNRFGRFMNLRDANFDVSITYSAVIRVNIVGEVSSPGTYTISSWNSAFNAVSIAQGTTDLGSVRKIEVRRGGSTIKILDLYKFLTDPASAQDFFLEDNDYLVVPAYQKVVTLEGEVKRPHTYEVLDHEQLTDVISYAGGLMPAAYTKNIQVQRFVGSQRLIIDVNYDSLITYGGDFDLANGDVIRIDTVSDVFENFVKVRGDINFPGQYELRSGYRIADILAKAQGNNKYDKIDQAYLIRLDEDYNPRYIPIDIEAILNNSSSEDNVLLEEQDIIEVIGKIVSVENYTVSVDGAVKNPGQFTYAKGMTLKDILFYAGGPKTEAAVDRIEVSRIVDYDASADEFVPTGKTDIQTVAIGYDLKNDAAAEEYILQPYDQIYVHIAEGFNYAQKVRIEGEVRFPGVYTMDSKVASVVDLIERAGGLTDAAFVKGATMYRGEQPEIGEVTGTNDQVRLVLELDRAIKSPESAYNTVLREGDLVSVPKTLDFVELSGLMYSPEIDTGRSVTVPFEKGKRAKYYVKNYGGGFDRRAKKNRTLVMEPNGKVSRTKEILWINIYP
ncbi:MAG: polysaccharide export outer membrane protein, partial [Limisphaerales bacterium]